jgi:hypothetical protein
MVAVNVGRPRTPLAKATATGRTVHDPKRFKARREPKSRALGRPSPELDVDERRAWAAFHREVPWLMEADRATVEAASRLRAQLWARKGDQIKLIGRLIQLLNQMGATPAARTKVHVPDGEEADAAEDFLN